MLPPIAESISSIIEYPFTNKFARTSLCTSLLPLLFYPPMLQTWVHSYVSSSGSGERIIVPCMQSTSAEVHMHDRSERDLPGGACIGTYDWCNNKHPQVTSLLLLMIWGHSATERGNQSSIERVQWVRRHHGRQQFLGLKKNKGFRLKSCW